MEAVEDALTTICDRIKEQEQRPPVSFREFMDLCAETPQRIFRNIFQMFYDMVHSHVGNGMNEYPDDPESINYVYYDTGTLFVKGVDHPFFADRLFANRLVNLVSSFKRGADQNRIYIFEGPHGCGKSTFLNNLLLRFEEYNRTEDGACYETVWRLSRKELGVISEQEARAILVHLKGLIGNPALSSQADPGESFLGPSNQEWLEFPCPSHDHPFLLIPKTYRRELLDSLISDEGFKRKIFFKKEFDWVFSHQPCTICMTLYQALLDIFRSPSKVYEMVFARRYQANRRLGEGISVYNPGDGLLKNDAIANPLLQNQLNGLLRDSTRVKYVFSRYAKTNNGIYALMDVKGHNKDRFANLHNVISEGVHKVEDIEENVHSLFLAVINPEDRENVSAMHSFADRVTFIKIPYVLDYNTEVKIYKKIFGDQIEPYFLPRVLQNFAKVIISSRLKLQSAALKEWICDGSRYDLYCDRNLHLLKMDIYTGLIPPWLGEADRKEFTAKRRRSIIEESEGEGDKGFSGRDSIKLFSQFYSAYSKKDKLINMAMVCGFFKNHGQSLLSSIPEGFLDSLVRLYDYTTLQEVKESLYYYNEARISQEIQNYLFAVNFEPGRTVRCVYTGEDLEIKEEFFEAMESQIMGPNIGKEERRSFRQDVQNHYASKTLTREIMQEGKVITETRLFQQLRERYVHNLKEKVLDPFMKNDNFRNGVKDYATESFKTYDKRIKEEVSLLVENLEKKYGYTEQGAKEVCMYVMDNKLSEKFPTQSDSR